MVRKGPLSLVHAIVPHARRLPRWWRLAAVAAATLAGIARSADEPAPPVRVKTAVDRAIAAVGDTIRYTVSIDHDPKVEVDFPQFPDTIAGFAVTNFGPLQTGEAVGRVATSRWYDLRHFLSGSYTIPGVAVEYRIPGEPKAMLRSADMFVQIESAIGADEDGAIRDIQEPEAASSRYVKYYAWGLVGLGLALAGILGAVIYQRRRAKSRMLGPPPVPAHELAYAQLAQLLELDLIAAGKIKEFYYALSTIARHYIEDRFRLMAPERTTEEFLAEMAGTSLLVDAHKGLIAEFLDHCDLVKFAKYAPSEKQIRATYDSAVRLIDETKEDSDVEVDEEEALEE